MQQSNNNTNYRFLDKRFRPTSIHDPVTAHFLAEVKQYKLHFLCEECVYFDDEKEVCVHGYPNIPHRRQYFEQDGEGKILIFCREYDLQ